MSNYPSERDFLINYAVRAFNLNTRSQLKPEECDIRSIPPVQHSTHGYLICTDRKDDNIRIALYFNISQNEGVHWVRLESQENHYATGTPGDEIWVIMATISDFWTNNLIYYFRDVYQGCGGVVIKGIPYAGDRKRFITLANGKLLKYAEEERNDAA